MDEIVIENDAMRVLIQPDYGARIVSLFDKTNARDWMFGGRVTRSGDDQSYGASDPVGWDECFPTVMSCDAAGTLWGGQLRDHGELWGRPWTVDRRTEQSVATSFGTPAFRFSRELSIAGPVLTAWYDLVNRTAKRMPFLWALHGLFGVTPDDRIVLPKVSDVEATSLVLEGVTLAPRRISWPQSDGRLPFDLDRVQPTSSNFAGKFYAGQVEGRVASLGHGSQWLDIRCSPEIADLGIWLNYGGWAKQPGTLHVGLEPTTASADDLCQALSTNTATWVEPGAALRWSVTLTFFRLGGDRMHAPTQP